MRDMCQRNTADVHCATVHNILGNGVMRRHERNIVHKYGTTTFVGLSCIHLAAVRR